MLCKNGKTLGVPQIDTQAKTVGEPLSTVFFFKRKQKSESLKAIYRLHSLTKA